MVYVHEYISAVADGLTNRDARAIMSARAVAADWMIEKREQAALLKIADAALEAVEELGLNE